MASLYDSASLVMIPSGVKEDKLYSIKPTDGSGDFTFSRGSDIQATRVNASGLIEKAKENLLLQSNSFDTTWVNTNTTETGGQTGYDGTNNAWLIEKSAGFGRIAQSISVSGVHTASVYVKAGTLSWCRFLMLPVAAGTDPQVYVNLATGALGSQYNNITATSTSVGGGWYRITLTFLQAVTEFRIYPAENDNTVSATSGSIYIQDAALCHGLIAQDYVETTTTAVVEGLTADLPRLDYSGGASCGSLLLEPSRTNLATHSEYFNTYSSTRLSVTANSSVSPEGVTNATKLTPDTNNASHYFIQTNSVTSGQKTTITFFAKADGYNFIRAVFSSVNSAYPDYYQSFDLSDGSLDDSSGVDDADIEPMGNGWYRCTATATAAASVVSSNYFFVFETSGTTAFAGNGTSGVLIYGLQVETNSSYPTSYIPTYGTAANRGADSCSKTGISSLIGQTEGTIFVDMNYTNTNNTADATPFRVLGSGSAQMYVEINTNETFEAVVVNSVGTLVFNSTSATQTAGRKKMAIAYKGSDFAYYINGTQIAVQTSGAFASASLDSLNLGMYSSGVQVLADSVNQTLVFPTRLTNAELAALTTL